MVWFVVSKFASRFGHWNDALFSYDELQTLFAVDSGGCALMHSKAAESSP